MMVDVVFKLGSTVLATGRVDASCVPRVGDTVCIRPLSRVIEVRSVDYDLDLRDGRHLVTITGDDAP